MRNPETITNEKTIPPGFLLVDEAYAASWIEGSTGPVDAVPTGLPTWDCVCLDEGGGIGLARGWYVIVGGASNTGKSILAGHLVASAMRSGEDVALVSLEMGHRSVTRRLLGQVTGQSISALSPGERFDSDAAAKAWANLNSLPGKLYMSSRAIGKLDDLTDAVAAFAAAGVRYVVIDYLQLVPVASAAGIYERVTEISQTLQRLAPELGIVVVALAQANKTTASNSSSPTMNGLSGSGHLAQDPDQIVMIDHTSIRKRQPLGTMKLILDKNRHGPTGTFSIRVDYRTLQVRELMPDEDPFRVG